MKKLNRREALQKGGRLIMGASAGMTISSFTAGCSNESEVVAAAEVLRLKIKPMAIEKLKISVIYDNYCYRKGLKIDWGFSCLIEGMDRTILFDTGRYDTLFMANMSDLGINPDQADLIFLSHEHPDHIGGMNTFLEHKSGIEVYIGKSVSSGPKKSVAEYGSKVVEVDNPIMVTNNSISSGEMKSFVKNEHSLFIDTTKGIVVITGCAHPGIMDIVKRAQKMMQKEILLVMGGFHLLMDSDSSIRDIAETFKDMKVAYVIPTHCSGSIAQKVFKETFGDNYLDGGVGRILTARDLT